MNIRSVAKRYYKASLLALLGILSFSSLAHAAPNPPSAIVVVPRYDAAISLVVSWNDNSGDETGFEIQRRAQGDVAYSPLVPAAIVGAGVISYEDNTATSDRMWEYQVRALGVAGDDSVWVGPSNASSPRIDWPVDDGSHNILHNYGNPLDNPDGSGALYYHDGVDFANEGQINASRGGLIASVSTSDNGAVRIDVDAGGVGTYRDVYGHLYGPDIQILVADVGDPVAPGEVLATSIYDFSGYGSDANHTHWETDLTGGGGKISVLSLFPSNADRDPQTNSPVVADVNDDGDDFIVVDAGANDPSSPREPAWGDVDLLVDAFDDMSTSTPLGVSPQNIGYWIQPGRPGAESVASSATPYRLISFDQALNLCGSPCPSEAIAENAVSDDLPADMHGINSWQSYYTWVVTNTSGTDGDPANIDGNQFWRTDARSGTGAEENGSDANRAREIQEARFPDGTYFTHVLLGDFVHSSDIVRSVLVDNSRPYVKRVSVFSGARIVYQAEWIWDGATAQLEIQPPTFDAATPFTALRTQDVTIEVEFSEPMATASIDDITPSGGAAALGLAPTLNSTEPEHARMIWRALISNLDIADDGSHDGTHLLTINGTDLAGNPLLQVNARAAMGADHHNRDAAGILRGTAGTDTIHGFRIGPLSGVIPVTAIFMKQGADDPVTPTIADKALDLEAALNAYFSEVSYDEISFAITPHGWYQLEHPLDWYETNPRTPLIDLVQEAITSAELNAVDLSDSDYVLVVTDEEADRLEWSTHGAWPYTVTAAPGWQLIATGTLNLASTDAHVTNLAGRMVGLIDLFAYPEVSVPRPFVGPWSHMSDKESNVHVLGWEKWRAGWLDETGTATGKTLTRVPKPDVASPIVDQDHTISALDSDADAVKMVAIEIGDRLHYTAEFRREQNLDSALPDTGVVILKSNDYINIGEGPAIIQESAISAGDLDDAPFTTVSPRDEFDDIGSGVNITIQSMDANEATIRLNYEVPPTENDVYVSPHDRWKAEDIWIDAPDLEGDFEADPLSVIDAGELPKVGVENRVYGRVRNQGHADATNFEVHLEIREPWGAGGPFRDLEVRTVPLLQGQDTNPNDYYLITGIWEPVGDIHSCVKLTVHGVPNDVNTENNWTQENFSQFDTTTDSPYEPVTSRFEVENPYDETITVFFKLDGVPPSWSYTLSPERLTIPAKGVGSAQVTLQPFEGTPVCSKEVVTVSAFTPRVDTLKELGGITLQIGLKNPASVNAETWVQCGQADPKSTALLARETRSFAAQECHIHTQGCTDPALPNTQVAIVYTSPEGSTEVRYVTTDENGCFIDTVTAPDGGRWETEVVIEGDDCREDASAPPASVDVPPTICGGPAWCCWLWLVFVIALIATLLWLARWRCDKPDARLPFIIALAITIALAWMLLTYCIINMLLFWLSILFAILIALILMCWTPFVPCIGRGRSG